MRKFLEACERHTSWAIFLLFGAFAICEFIYRIGIIDDVGFAGAFAQLITIFLLLALIGSIMVAMIKRNINYIKITGTGLMGYHLVSVLLAFPEAFKEFETNEWTFILAGSFMIISLIMVVLVTFFYLLSVFAKKYHFLNKASIFMLMLNVIVSVLAFIMVTIYYNKIDNTWYSYFRIAILYLIVPQLMFFGVMYLYPKVNALGDNNKEIGEVVDFKEEN